MEENNGSKVDGAGNVRLNDGLGELTPKEIWWIRENRRTESKRGAYWLTCEGRAEIREAWDDAEDGNAVLPLLNALEELEARNA